MMVSIGRTSYSVLAKLITVLVDWSVVILLITDTRIVLDR